MLFAILVILCTALYYWLASPARTPDVANNSDSSWKHEYGGDINNNMNMTTSNIEADEMLSKIHLGAVKHIESKYPELVFAKNRPYCFDKRGKDYSLGYRTRSGAPKHNYIVIDFISATNEYKITPIN